MQWIQIPEVQMMKMLHETSETLTVRLKNPLTDPVMSFLVQQHFFFFFSQAIYKCASVTLEKSIAKQR